MGRVRFERVKRDACHAGLGLHASLRVHLAMLVLVFMS
jgi:hypothetical protein